MAIIWDGIEPFEEWEGMREPIIIE